MIVLKHLQIQDSLTRYLTVNKAHECAYCGAVIHHRSGAMKASFRYDNKLYPLYFHSSTNQPCFTEFLLNHKAL